MALLDITSLKFIFDCVPEPVCQITSGKCLSRSPLITSSDASKIALAIFLSSLPAEALTLAAAFLTPPDPFSQISLALPIIILYEISIYLAKIVSKNKDK